MPHDLAISDHNDLIFSANRDLAMVFGTDLIEQRIRLRLKIIRGQWIYDETKTLGSELRQILHEARQKDGAKVEALVRAALVPIKDVHIGAIDIFQGESERELMVRVNYSTVPSTGLPPTLARPTKQFEFPLTFQP